LKERRNGRSSRKHPNSAPRERKPGGDVKIGIIGTGAIGGTLARGLANLGHQVSIANSRGPETVKELAAEIGAKAVSVRGAARAGDVVILSIPQKAVSQLPKDLFASVPSSVVVIDTGNYTGA
jgi:predicted dinucleotide-binding enzyme